MAWKVKRTPPAENQIAIRAGGEGAAPLNQRNVKGGEIVARETRGGCAAKATPDNDNAPGACLGMGNAGRGKRRRKRCGGKEGAAGKGHDLFPPAYCGRA